MLSDKELKKLALCDSLVSPFVEKNCAGATIDITLSNVVKYYDSDMPIILGQKIDESLYKEVDISEEEFFLNPNCSVLVVAEEYFKIPIDTASIILERYSLKLLGLSVSPASYMNPGYQGKMSFVATNLTTAPIRLVPGIKFAQIALFQLSSEPDKPYGKQNCKYLGEQSISTSKLHLDEEIQEFLYDRGVACVSRDTAKVFGDFLMDKIRNSADNIVTILRERDKKKEVVA